MMSSMKPLRIIITGDNGESIPPPYGGIMKRCLLHAREWKAKGADVHIHVHHRHDKENDLGSNVGRFYDFARKPGFVDRMAFLAKNFFSDPALFTKLFLLEKRLFPNFDFTYFAYCAGRGVVLERAVKRLKPDVIVTETAGLQSLIALEIGKRNGIPVALENYAEIQYKAKADGVNVARRYEKLWRHILEGVDLVVPASEHCAKGPRTYLGESPKIRIVYSGISFDVFFGRMLSSQKTAREKFKLPQDKFLVMAVGALKMRKGHDHLFEALLTLPAETRSRMAVVLCGMGDIPELKARAAEIGFPDSSLFVFQGLTEEDLAELYSSVDCFCFPSVTPRECMGMAMKEAMAIGLPVVAYDTGGISEAIQNGVNGILAPTGDKAALGRGVAAMMQISEGEKAAYRTKNAEKARRMFDIKKTAGDLYQLLVSISKRHD